MKKKIIITGGAGFIGSHLNHQLVSKGHKVFIIDSNRSYLNFNHDLYSNYYKDIFAWLNSCENLFGFHNLKGYGMTRIYGFLAERFMSYWFKKNTNYVELPIIFHDINK